MFAYGSFDFDRAAALRTFALSGGSCDRCFTAGKTFVFFTVQRFRKFSCSVTFRADKNKIFSGWRCRNDLVLRQIFFAMFADFCIFFDHAAAERTGATGRTFGNVFVETELALIFTPLQTLRQFGLAVAGWTNKNKSAFDRRSCFDRSQNRYFRDNRLNFSFDGKIFPAHRT